MNQGIAIIGMAGRFPGAASIDELFVNLENARDTLENLQRLWSRPVHLETRLEDSQVVLSFDGSEHKLKKDGSSEDREDENEEDAA